jgi:hypothetical protein
MGSTPARSVPGGARWRSLSCRKAIDVVNRSSVRVGKAAGQHVEVIAHVNTTSRRATGTGNGQRHILGRSGSNNPGIAHYLEPGSDAAKKKGRAWFRNCACLEPVPEIGKWAEIPHSKESAFARLLLDRRPHAASTSFRFQTLPAPPARQEADGPIRTENCCRGTYVCCAPAVAGATSTSRDSLQVLLTGGDSAVGIDGPATARSGACSSICSCRASAATVHSLASTAPSSHVSISQSRQAIQGTSARPDRTMSDEEAHLTGREIVVATGDGELTALDCGGKIRFGGS